MANSASGTLVANTATPITVRSWDLGLWVINRATDGTEIWARLDGIAASVGGAGCFIVLGARNFPTGNTNITVSLISSGTPNYSVEGAVVAVAV